MLPSDAPDQCENCLAEGPTQKSRDNITWLCANCRRSERDDTLDEDILDITDEIGIDYEINEDDEDYETED